MSSRVGKVRTDPRQLEEQFRSVTNASQRDARAYISKYKRIEDAINAYYNQARPAPQASKTKLNDLFDLYKDPDSGDIAVEGTEKMCDDLGISLEDVVVLAIAYECKSPSVGVWVRKDWVEGWANHGADTIDSMKKVTKDLRTKLGKDPAYFHNVYNYTFEFAKSEGQRSIAVDTAMAFWSLLLPHGLAGGALSRIQSSEDDDDDDVAMTSSDGWTPAHTDLWFQFLNEKGGKGVSKDTWQMFHEFIRTIDARFSNYDIDGAWPSTIDDFVEWGKEKVDFL